MGKYEFGGYSFATEKEMEIAKKEAESIEYIKTKTDFRNHDKLKKIYDTLIEKNSFVSPVGIAFMKTIQDELTKFSNQTVQGVPAAVPLVQKKGEKTGEFSHVMEERKKAKEEMYRNKLRNSRVISGFLILIIIAMFCVVLFSDKSPFADAERKMQDKYAGWEQQLKEKEQQLNQREEILDNKQ